MIFEKQIVNAYRAMAFTRCDDRGLAYYFSPSDFPGLQWEHYTFRSSMGHDLKGALYCYDAPRVDRLVIFDHGFGGGHRSYMKEIERLCRHGFLVLAYDHTGCMESGGESTNGMAQSLRDLNDCLTAVKQDPRFAGRELSVMGHSWGGFSTMNIAALHPEIRSVVVLSGFVSVPLLVNSYFGGLLRGYRKAILKLEQQVNPVFSAINGVESLNKTQASALLIYSDNDKLCRKKPHFDALMAGLKERESLELVLVGGKGHNPNYTADAVGYLGDYLAQVAKMTKRRRLESEEARKAFRESFDWDRMTAQDESIWERILGHLDR